MSAHATATIVMMEATDTTVRAASSDGDVAGRSPDRGVGRLHHHDRGGGVGAHLKLSREQSPMTHQVSPTQQTQSAMTATFVLATAYAVAAPYALPWYDVLAWATLPLMLATALDGILLARLTVMVLAYVPG